MPSSFRLPVVLGIGLFIGLGGVAWSLIDSPPAFGLEAPALHAPPPDYQPIGPCVPNRGVPYQHTERRMEAPLLFYYRNELTMLVHLLEERAIPDGQTWTLLSDLGGISLAEIAFGGPSQRGGLHDLLQLQGSYYQLWIYLERGRPGTSLPC